MDYLQDIALLNACREAGNKLVFKGGTCLYKVHQLNRFSEDLDFSAGKGFVAKEFFQRLPPFFGLLGIACSLRLKPFDRGVNAFLDVRGPLYDGKKESLATLVFNVSLRERIQLPAQRHLYTPVYNELRPFDLFVLDEREILAEKVRAIYERDKARDLFDAWFLLKKKSVSFDIGLVNKKLSKGKLRFEKNAFLGRIDEKRLGWERDLRPLVQGELPPFTQIKNEIRQALPHPSRDSAGV